MLNQFAVEIPTLPVDQCHSHLIQYLNVETFFRIAEPQRRAAKLLGTHGISGNVFANPTASSSAPYPQESDPWVSNVSEHTSPHVMSESQTPVQSGPSARSPVILVREDSQRIMGQTDNDCRFQILNHTSNVRLLEDKIL